MMDFTLGLFKRAAPVDTSALGETVLAMAVAHGSAIASGCTAVLIDSGGRTRRAAAGAPLALAPGETAWLFRPGPYRGDLRPFAAAPELGLRLCLVIDGADPRVQQQRFDLYLASEVQGVAVTLDAAALFAAIESALQRELAQGHLALPPCTTLDEWNSFRAGLNQLLYLRFGVTIDECLPVDLGDHIDYAAMLTARAAAGEVECVVPAPPAPMPAPAPAPPSSARDQAAMRRLFLELPCLMGGWRTAVLPRGAAQFRRQQALLRRLDLVSLAVTTMPALALAAPGVPLEPGQQARRANHSARACASLDDGWALLARLQLAEDGLAGPSLETLFDDAERIVANLECDVAGRRAVFEKDPDFEKAPS